MFDNEADPTEASHNYRQTLNRTAELCKPALFNILPQKGARREVSAPLHFAARSKCNDEQRAAMMEHLRTLGFGINERDGRQGPNVKGTPLHHAIKARNC